MPTSVTYNGTTYSIPANREPKGWGTSLSSFLVDVANSSLSKAGGNFTLTADVNFGSNYSLVVKYIKSVSSNPASDAAGNVVRLANNEGVAWRNAANGADKILKLDAGDRLEIDGIDIVTLSSTDTLTNKTLTSPVINTPTGIVKGDVGLGNLDNTSDLNKPISTLTQAALDAKAPLASPTFTGTVSGITASMVGLGNVDNTSDATKNAASATLTNKTITSPIIDNGLTMNHESTPATPSAGTVKVYPKSDNSLYVLDPNGFETQIGAGGGSLSWGDAVASVASLPGTGVVGEVRQTLDTKRLYRWNGSVWEQAGNIFDPNGEVPALATAAGINTYQSRTVISVGQPVRDIAEGNGFFLAIGSSVSAYSRDTYSWTLGGNPTTPSVRTIAFGNGTFVAASNTGSCASTDNGLNWSANTALPGGGTSNSKLFYLNGFFIIIGTSGYLATSPNGTAWTQRTTGITNAINGVAYSSSLGLYVAVGGTTGVTDILTSTDLATWTPRTAPVTNQQLWGIAWAGTTFATCGDGGTILTSTNGTSWTSRTSGTANQLWDVVTIGGFFLTFELSNSVRHATVSGGGVTWSQVTTTGNVAIVRALSRFVVVGDQSTNSVLSFSRTCPGIAFSDQTSGIGRTDTGQIGIIDNLVPVAQFGATGAIIRGQTNAANLTAIATSGSLKIGEPIKGYHSGSSTTGGATVAGLAAAFGTNYGLFLLQASAKFTGTIGANSNIAFAVGLGSGGWAFHSTGSAFRTGENATVFKLESGSANYTMTTTYPMSITTPMVLVQFDATNGFTLYLPNGNVVFAGPTLSVCTRIDGSGISAMTRETYMSGYRIT